MKKWTKIFGLLLIIMFLLAGTSLLWASPSEEPITILFTHDLHDNLLPFNQEKDGNIVSCGGYARLQTVIKQQRAQDSELVLLDGGDFSMGTLFQTIYSQQAPGIRLLGQMGYDATTLGNHEFDFRSDGLADSLNAAKASKERLPQLVAANISYPVDSQGKTIGADLQKLQQAMGEYGVKPYTIMERKGVRIGIFGIIGKDAASNAPKAGVTFADPIEQARSVVDKIKQQEKVDMIICLSHSGTVADRDESEDVILAQEVPEINVIISGHSHSTLEQPIIVGDTIICSAGEYGQNLGMITVEKRSADVWEKIHYRLIPINDGIAADSEISKRIDAFKTIVQNNYLDRLGMKFDEKLAYSPFSFASITKIGRQHAEQPLGNLISDAYIYAVKQAEGADYQPVDAAIVPNGTIRASFVKGDITVADAFNASSLGIGKDKKSGYPLISVYLTGKELKTACEVDGSIAPIMPAAQLYISGLTYTFNPHRLIFNKVTDAALQKPDGSRVEIDDNKLYRVVAGLYSAQMLSVVGDKSFGILSIVPKTKEGVPITDFEAEIITDSAGGSNGEIKEWAAIAKYLQSFKQVNGVPQVPDYYRQTQGRKIIDQNSSLGAIMFHPNKIALIIYSVIVVLILLFVLLVRFIFRHRRKKVSFEDSPSDSLSNKL